MRHGGAGLPGNEGGEKEGGNHLLSRKGPQVLCREEENLGVKKGERKGPTILGEEKHEKALTSKRGIKTRSGGRFGPETGKRGPGGEKKKGVASPGEKNHCSFNLRPEGGGGEGNLPCWAGEGGPIPPRRVR